MALVVDTTVRFMNPPSGQNFTFKLSKPLNQLTIDDIKSQDAYVGFTNFAINTIGEGVLSQGSPVNNPNHCYMWATDDSSLYSDINEVGHWCNPPAFPDGVYMRNILVYAPLTISNNGSFIKADSASRIVIDITPDANTSMQKLAIGSDGRLVCWYSNDTLSENRVDNYYYIYPAILFEINDTTYIYTQELSPRWASFYINSILDQGFNSNTARVNFNNESYHRLAYGWTVGATSIGENFFTKFDENRQIENYNINGHIVTFKVNVGASNYHWRVSESMTDNADKTVTKQYYANTGFRFKIDNVWYKPIISGGIVTGYTDDMTVPSEWDSWTKASGHNVPSGGGGGGGSEENDKFESMTTGFSSAIGGITKYYKMSYSGLISLINDFNQHAPAGTTISNSIVSLYVNALVNSWTTFNTPIEIHTAGAQETPFTSVLEYPELYLFANPMEQLGYIDVPRVTNTFYDYNPYSTYELYVPFCGWIGLPDTIAGRRLRVELHMDIATMNCRALVRCEVDNGHGYDSTLCGEISGAIGAPCPLEVIEGGLYRQSFVNSALQLVSGGTMAIVGGMSGANALMASGAMNAIQGLANARMAGNTNYTQVVGRSGDCSGLAGAHKCYLKISHPVVDKVVETSLFGHSVGYICDIVDKLKNFKGFTVCLNPHITINATQTEKEEIKRLLEDGVIL